MRNQSIVLALAMAALLAGCNSTATSAQAPSHTFTAVATGHNGPVKVGVTVASGHLIDIRLVESTETSGIGNVAFEKIRQQVLARQSLDVDLVTGATVSSGAVRLAIGRAVKAAQLNLSALAQDGRVVQAPQTLDTDIVVVGSGGAGMAAAIEAARAGAKVVVLEKLGRTGGSTRTSSAMILVGGSPLQKEAGISDSPEALKQYWLDRGQGKVDAQMVSFAADKANAELQFLTDIGVGYTSKLILQSGTATVNRAHLPPQYGADLSDRMDETARGLGIKTYTETKALSLIQKGGRIVGVKARQHGADFTVNAKAVILATGGFDHNEALKAQYSPKAVGAYAVSAPQNNGDGLVMGMAVGADTVFKGGVIGWKVVSPAYGHTTYEGQPLYGAANLIVNAAGKRIFDESLDYPFFFEAMAADGGKNFYYVFDSAAGATSTIEAQTETVKSLEAAVKAKVAFKGVTIAELAANAQLPGLTSSADQFNGAIAAGKDTAFGRDTKTMQTLVKGPFYALQCQRATLGTFGGLKVKTSGEVLDKAGKPIAGLFAAGEVANGDFFSDIYPASGSSLGMSIIFGREAGKSAAAQIR